MTALNTSGIHSLKPFGNLLLVEDDQTIRETIAESLEIEGFKVKSFNNGETAYKTICSNQGIPIDLIILDLMLPGLNGLDLCKKLREHKNSTPILIISAKDSEADRVLGLDVGADDYLVKPFGIKELIARCRALIRRASKDKQPQLNPTQELYQHSNLCIYSHEYRVTKDNVELDLSPKEYKLLEMFVQNPKRVLSRDQILEKIWGIDFVGDTKTVDVHIRWLREKIEDEPSTPKLIRTVRGFGYRFD